MKAKITVLSAGDDGSLRATAEVHSGADISSVLEPLGASLEVSCRVYKFDFSCWRVLGVYVL